MLKRCYFLCVVIIFLTVITCQAEFQVNTYTNNEQQYPASAINTNGDFVVAWRSEGQDGGSRGIYGQRFDADGTPVGSEFQINTSSVAGCTYCGPSVAMDSLGNFVVTWTGSDGSSEGIYARRYDANGQPLTGEFLVNSYTDSRQLDPSVAMSSNGNFVIVWQSYYHSSHLWFIRGQLFNSSGTPVGGEFIISETTRSGKWADVEMNDSGEFVVSWCRDSTGYYPSLRQYNSNGTPKGNVVYLDNIYVAMHTAIGIDNNGNFIIVWNKSDIYAQLFNTNGNKIGNTFVVNTYTGGTQRFPSAVMNDDGDFMVVWDGPGTGDSGGIFGQRYKSDGTLVGEEFQINTYIVSDQKYANVAMKDNGEFAAVWQSDGQDGSGYGIFGEFGPNMRPRCADFNGDLFINFHDFCVLANEWLEEGDLLETDLINDNRIDERDLAIVCGQWLTPCYECSEVDIYSDGKINFKDYAFLAANWLKQGPNLDGDFTGDWIVDMADLKALVFHWLTPCYECSEVDIYSDGKIDFKDYAFLAANWLKQGPNLDGDFTGDWIVDTADLTVLVFHWLENCE